MNKFIILIRFDLLNSQFDLVKQNILLSNCAATINKISARIHKDQISIMNKCLSLKEMITIPLMNNILFL